MGMAEEVRYAKRTRKDAFQKSCKSIVRMSNRLKSFKDLNFLVGELNEELADESHFQKTLQKMSTILLQINCEIFNGY